MEILNKFSTTEGYCTINSNELITTRGEKIISEIESKKLQKKVIFIQSIYPITALLLGIRKIYYEDYQMGVLFLIATIVFGYNTFNIIRETNKSKIKVLDIKNIKFVKPFLGLSHPKFIIQFTLNKKNSRKTIKLPEKELENLELAKKLLNEISQ